MTPSELRATIEACGVHPLLGPTGAGWGIEQNPWELAEFLTWLQPHSIHTVLELGTGHRAGLSRFLAEVMNYDVTTVDIAPSSNEPSKALKLVMPTVDAAVYLEGQRFDVVFIDADHHYAAVKRDHELFRKRGRIIAFHDVAGKRSCYGSAAYWHQGAYIGRRLRECFYEAIALNSRAAGIGWYDREALFNG